MLKIKKTPITLLAIILSISFAFAATDINIIFTNSTVTNTSTQTFYEFDVKAWVNHTGPIRLGDGQFYVQYNTAVFGDNIAESSTLEITEQGPIANGSYSLLPSSQGANNKPDIFSFSLEAYSPKPSDYTDSYIPNSESSAVTIYHIKMEVANAGEEYGELNIKWPIEDDYCIDCRDPALFTDYDNVVTFDAIVPTNTTENDIIYIIEGDPALPVTLESFIAEYNKGAVELEWSTASETQNAGFVVKRARGEDSEDPDYQVIASYMHDASLRGAGTSTEQNRYSHRDGNIKPGATYSYILEDVDHSGNVTRHDPVTVTVPDNVLFANADFRLEPAYPNPFNPAFTLPLELSRPMDVTMNMYDITGRKVRTIAGGRMEAGNYEFRVDGRDLNSGIYFVRSVIGDQVLTQKMLLVK